MKQFNLSEWLQDKSRKVVTRDGRSVRILCTDCGVMMSHPILTEIVCSGNAKVLEYHYIDGTTQNKNNDLFFADEEEKSRSIEIPFGAKDSEFIRDEYCIPEGCEARIEGNKVIIEKIQKEEELTEFDKELSVKGLTWKDVNTLDTLIDQVRHEFPNGMSEKSFGLAVLEKFQDYYIEEFSEDLKEEINRVEDWYPVELKYIQEIANHFVEWQKQKDKQLIGATQKISFQHGYDEGRFDMREEMMKDAVDAVIFSELKGNDGSLFQAKSDRFKMNDVKISNRIKVIPIKTEQQ